MHFAKNKPFSNVFILLLVLSVIHIYCGGDSGDKNPDVRNDPTQGSEVSEESSDSGVIIFPSFGNPDSGDTGELPNEILEDGDLTLEPDRFTTANGDQLLHTMETFVIYGSGFDQEDLKVTIGNSEAFIQYNTDEMIEGIAPGSLPSGKHPLSVMGSGDLVLMEVDYSMLLYATVDQPTENFRVYALDKSNKAFVPFNSPDDGFTLDASDETADLNSDNVGQQTVDAFWGQVFINRPRHNLITVLDSSSFRKMGEISVTADTEAIAATPYDTTFLSYCERFLVVGDKTNERVHFYGVKDPWPLRVSKDLPTGVSEPVEIAIDRTNKHVFVASAGETGGGGNIPHVAVYMIKSETAVDDVTKITADPRPGNKTDSRHISVAVDPIAGPTEKWTNPETSIEYDLPNGLVFFTNNSKRFLYILNGKYLSNVTEKGDICDIDKSDGNNSNDCPEDEVFGSTRAVSGIDLSAIFPQTNYSMMGISPMVVTPLEVHLIVRVSSDAKRVYVYDKNDDGIIEKPLSTNLPRIALIDTENFTLTQVDSPVDEKLFVRGLVSPFGYSELYMIGRDYEGNFGRERGQYLFELTAATAKSPGPSTLNSYQITRPLKNQGVLLRDMD